MQRATSPDRPASPDRGRRLRDIVAEVTSMVARAQDLGDHAQAESLRVLLRHFESELVRLPGLEGGSGDGDRLGRAPRAMERTSAPPDREGDA